MANLRTLARRACSTLVVAIATACGTSIHTNTADLSVPSPDWRDQIVYFVVTDRFADGDPTNDNQDAGEFDPTNNAKYSGGDLRGIEQKIAYIQQLGATAIWLTPPVANQWWDPRVNYGGYHGYWASNFMEVDKHMGSLGDYQALSIALHQAGMYLIQDIVVNHTGDFFYYNDGWNPNDPAQYWARNTGSVPTTAPTQSPFDMDDPTDPAQRVAAIYHWTPDISDFNDENQLLNYQLYGLDDLNTENPTVRSALRKSYGYWISTVGVDAFRIDTAFYVPQAFFSDFMYSTDATAPGIEQVAQANGKQNFLAFGEGFATDAPYDDTNSKKIESYMADSSGNDILPAMLNYPLYGTLGDVLHGGHPTAELGYRIADMMQVFKRPYLMPTFLDNHDVDRFLADGSVAGLQQGLVLIMTLPGIPVIYYGTEQAFTEQRGAMFAGGYASGGVDHFDTNAPLYQFIAQLTALRRQNLVFSRGTPAILDQDSGGPGAFAYRMSYGDVSAVVAINTSDTQPQMRTFATGLRAGTLLENETALNGSAAPLVVAADGTVSVTLPVRSAFVWIAGPNAKI
ncbi:alpha-amylase family glycosyl hydrolase [Paraburkholderia phosphatilytica]|uniref:alpha-amylase family glycosyl hydrolase n=1 Tax=Paraburkholderia phosphatilytica TaxID=2282883 RepID=UPI000E4F28BD|nr:alpha-amylase family glycosyl hydrolase [Paraburkholderia phosphatilytica]